MIRLLKPDAAPVEFVIPDGKFAGCVLTARRPTVSDQLAYTLARSNVEAFAARLRLVNGWRGANGEASPFMDERSTPMGFTDEAFNLACQEDEEFLDWALMAGLQALQKSAVGDEALGKSERPSL